MKKLGLIVALVLLPLVTAVFAREPQYRFFSDQELAKTVAALPSLRYPATQAEVFAKLGIAGRSLPISQVSESTQFAGGDAYRRRTIVALTDPEAARRYYLQMWYDENALEKYPRQEGPVIGYVELIYQDRNLNALFVAQSSRYPYINLSFSTRPRQGGN